jgi:hypothetical protein
MVEIATKPVAEMEINPMNRTSLVTAMSLCVLVVSAGVARAQTAPSLDEEMYNTVGAGAENAATPPTGQTNKPTAAQVQNTNAAATTPTDPTDPNYGPDGEKVWAAPVE